MVQLSLKSTDDQNVSLLGVGGRHSVTKGEESGTCMWKLAILMYTLFLFRITAYLWIRGWPSKIIFILEESAYVFKGAPSSFKGSRTFAKMCRPLLMVLRHVSRFEAEWFNTRLWRSRPELTVDLSNTRV